jgi:hypothetical protein
VLARLTTIGYNSSDVNVCFRDLEMSSIEKIFRAAALLRSIAGSTTAFDLSSGWFVILPNSKIVCTSRFRMQKTYHMRVQACRLSSAFSAQRVDSGTICHHCQPCNVPHNIANHQNPAHTLVLQLAILPLGLLLVSSRPSLATTPTVMKHDTKAPPGQCVWHDATFIFVNGMLNMVT